VVALLLFKSRSGQLRRPWHLGYIVECRLAVPSIIFMFMRKARRVLTVLTALALAGPIPAWPSASPDNPVKAMKAYTTITGIAWDGNNNPIAGARVRLRNVATTRVVAATRANEAGRFTFENIEGGSYVVELMSENGKVLGVGPLFNALPGDNVATFVRLTSHAPGLAGLFGNTAAAIVTSAAGLGITAVSKTGRDVSPETAKTGTR
jgi:carboxypeptidase family protein